MKSTHKFKLCSGPECEVTELTGKHQRLLTEQGSKTHSTKLNEMLADVIVRIGNTTFPVLNDNGKDVTEDFLNKMLSCDKKKILVEVRQYTLDFQPDFAFTYKYVDSKGDKQEYEVEVTLDENGSFPMTTPKVEADVDVDGEMVKQLVSMDFETYEEVLTAKECYTILPRSGERVRFTMLDGRGEAVGTATKKADRSSHTLIKMRNPVRFVTKEGSKNETPIQLDLDRVAYLDLEHLRKKIKEVEGRVDTETMFEHPEAELKSSGDKDVILDLVTTVAFFFPSEAI